MIPIIFRVFMFFLFHVSFELFERLLLQARYVGARNTAALGGLALCERGAAAEPVAKANDLGLAFVEHIVDHVREAAAEIGLHDALGHVLLVGQNVHQRKGIAVGVGVDGIRKRKIARAFSVAAKMHEHFVFNASGSVSRKAHAPVRAVCGYALDETHRSDGDEIVLVAFARIVFFDYVCHKTQVVFDERVPGFQIPLHPALHTAPLLPGGQRPRKRAGTGTETQREKRAVEQK